MDIKKQLEDIVGADRLFNTPDVLEKYSCDQSFVPKRMPDYVVKVKTTEEIQKILELSNKEKIPVVPYSSGLNLHGATIPKEGGIIVDLSLMDKIIEINEADWFVIIEPGVTYKKLQDTVEEKGFRVMVPWAIPEKRSVLTSYLERDPVLASASFEYGNYLIMDTELVLPEGNLFRTGCWNLGGKPGGFYGPGLNTIYSWFSSPIFAVNGYGVSASWAFTIVKIIFDNTIVSSNN